MFRLEKTCDACPEQYDVFFNEVQVGYMRLRHGWFRAEYKGEIVYEARPCGDGAFTDLERPFFLDAALAAIQRAMEKDDGRRRV